MVAQSAVNGHTATSSVNGHHSNGHANGNEHHTETRSERLNGKVAIVTGGSAGFGAAITRQFVTAGAKVVVVDINDENGLALKKEAPADIEYLHGDVTRESAWVEAGQLAMRVFGRITTVVNNAGISYQPKPTHLQPIELYDKVFNLNVRPIFLSVQVMIPFMDDTSDCSFINISSTGYTRPRPGFAFYNASKAAVTTATKTMALEYAPKIRFNAISPALGNTSMLQVSIQQYDDPDKRLQELCSSIPMGRPTEPSDVANAAVYLASQEASFVTGTLLEVDGGRGI